MSDDVEICSFKALSCCSYFESLHRSTAQKVEVAFIAFEEDEEAGHGASAQRAVGESVQFSVWGVSIFQVPPGGLPAGVQLDRLHPESHQVCYFNPLVLKVNGTEF